MAAPNPWASTSVRPDAEHHGCWHATVDEVWVAATVPLGGISAAVAARAMGAELATQHPASVGQRLRSIHCLFAAPVPAGPVEADVTVLRSGRSLSQAQVTLRAPGARNGLTALGAFGAPRTGYSFTEAAPPDVPPPEACRSFREPPLPGRNTLARSTQTLNSRRSGDLGVRRAATPSTPFEHCTSSPEEATRSQAPSPSFLRP